jgi:large subunit ribosomal protein L23
VKDDKKEEKGKVKKEEIKKTDKKEIKKSETKKTVSGNFKKSVIKAPWITEKARDMNAQGKYIFLVEVGANKSEVKKEIEQRYDVSVIDVNILRKKYNPSSYRGRKSGKRIMKKAIITLKKGNSIEIFPV